MRQKKRDKKRRKIKRDQEEMRSWRDMRKDEEKDTFDFVPNKSETKEERHDQKERT